MKNIISILTIVGIIVLVGLFLFLPRNTTIEQKTNTLENIIKNGEITVCVIPYPPTVIKDPNTGKYSGEMIDAIEYIANESNLKINYVETAWGTFIAALQTKQCNLVVTGLFSKIERAKVVAFTEPMFYIGDSALIKKGDNRFKTLQDLNKKEIKIAVIQGETGDLFAQKNLQNAQLIELPGADISLALAQVSSGQADVAITDAWTINSYSKQHQDTQDISEINQEIHFDINPVTWAVRYDDLDLLSFLNTSIKILEINKKFQEWEKKYDAHWLREDTKLKIE